MCTTLLLSAIANQDAGIGNKFTLDVAKVSNMPNGPDFHIARIHKCAENDAMKPVIERKFRLESPSCTQPTLTVTTAINTRQLQSTWGRCTHYRCLPEPRTTPVPSLYRRAASAPYSACGIQQYCSVVSGYDFTIRSALSAFGTHWSSQKRNQEA